ncbi:hypothetical protein ABPG72_000660 [Tetrahymena utriculariae]
MFHQIILLNQAQFNISNRFAPQVHQILSLFRQQATLFNQSISYFLSCFELFYEQLEKYFKQFKKLDLINKQIFFAQFCQLIKQDLATGYVLESLYTAMLYD